MSRRKVNKEVTRCECGNPIVQTSRHHQNMCPECRRLGHVRGRAKQLENLPLCACGKHIYKTGHTQCWDCRPRERKRIEVVCPACGAVRLTTPSHANSGEFQPLCKECRKVELLKKMGRLPRKLKLKINSFRVNGCVIQPAKSGRCEGYMTCPNGWCAPLLDIPREQECNHIAAHLNWDGYKCARGSKPGGLTEEQIETIVAQTNVQKENTFFLQAIEMYS